MTLSPEHRRALTLLANSPRGITEALMIDAHGFTIELMVKLVGDGLASAGTRTVGAGDRKIEVANVQITNEGRTALGLRLR